MCRKYNMTYTQILWYLNLLFFFTFRTTEIFFHAWKFKNQYCEVARQIFVFLFRDQFWRTHHDPNALYYVFLGIFAGFSPVISLRVENNGLQKSYISTIKLADFFEMRHFSRILFSNLTATTLYLESGRFWPLKEKF